MAKSGTAANPEAPEPRKSPYQMTKQEYRDFMAKGKELTPEETATIDANHEKYVSAMRKSLNKGIVPPEVRAEYPKLFPKARKYGPKYSLEEMEQKGEERKRSMGAWEGMGGGVLPGKRKAAGVSMPGKKSPA